MKKPCILSALAIVFFLGVATGSAAGTEEKEEAGGTSGQSLYFRYCSQCHGPGGKGDGVNSTEDMLINPSDHSDPAFMTTRSDEQLREVIKEGGTRLAKSPLMPSWEKTLTDAEIDAVVRYLRRLCKCGFEGVVSHRKLRRVEPDFR